MNLADAKFGDMVLDVDDLRGTAGRDWVTQSPSRGDDHSHLDRGKRLKRTTCTINFCKRDQNDDHIARLIEFQKAADDGTQAVFVHPIAGSYLAIVDSFEFRLTSADDVITVDASFLAVVEPKPVSTIGAGVKAHAGVYSVQSKIADVPASAGLDTTSILAKIEAWADSAAETSNLAAAEIDGICAQIDAAIEATEAATTIETWPIYRSLIALRYECTLAAIAASATTDRLISYTVDTATPLRVFCVNYYGPEYADDAEDSIRSSNVINEPGLLRPGQQIQIPPKGSSF